MNRHTLFTNVQEYYQNLVAELASARHAISMTFLAFDSGVWAEQISEVLVAKAAQGVNVRLMVDEIGQVFDKPAHAAHTSPCSITCTLMAFRWMYTAPLLP